MAGSGKRVVATRHHHGRQTHQRSADLRRASTYLISSMASSLTVMSHLQHQLVTAILLFPTLLTSHKMKVRPYAGGRISTARKLAIISELRFGRAAGPQSATPWIYHG